MKKYFTKSRFKIALDCPTKLYYASQPEDYASKLEDDEFLRALARGGFQVGELAKLYYPGGIEVNELDYETSLLKTNELLKNENIVIFEAAILYRGLFVRVDILEKKGNIINLIEVKSKSCNPTTFEDELWNKNELKKGVHALKGDWFEYVYDLAFQGFVAKKAFPKFQYNHFLMCADKTKKATVSGLNQRFLIDETSGCSKVTVVDLEKALGEKILSLLDCNEVVSRIHLDEEMSKAFGELNFEKAVLSYAKAFDKKQKINAPVSKACKDCEFRIDAPGKKNGFNECWKNAYGLRDDELSEPFVFDIWNFRGAEKLIDQDKVLLCDIDKEDISIRESDDGSLSPSARQWLQIEKYQNQDETPYLDLAGLKIEFDQFNYPLHMIDFECCTTAIPFNSGMHPYELTAFQFSHHIIEKDGTITHQTEYLNNQPGVFPNFDFVRALKKALGKKGSVFSYSPYENTVLLKIREQLLESNESDAPSDRDELVEFIESITKRKEGREEIKGKRNMIDLAVLVRKYFYSPHTKGSNSIKAILPAILHESSYLQEKYSRPIYGNKIISKNFKDHKLITRNRSGDIINPYKTLPQVFDQYDYESLELICSDATLADGGAAQTFYAMMQFTHMSEEERKKVSDALLRYCELDSFSMCLIWEYWNKELENV
jgi:hypothetical protein